MKPKYCFQFLPHTSTNHLNGGRELKLKPVTLISFHYNFQIFTASLVRLTSVYDSSLSRPNNKWATLFLYTCMKLQLIISTATQVKQLAFDSFIGNRFLAKSFLMKRKPIILLYVKHTFLANITRKIYIKKKRYLAN